MLFLKCLQKVHNLITLPFSYFYIDFHLASSKFPRSIALGFEKFPHNINPLFHVLNLGYSATWKHDDVIKWKHFPRYWPFVRGIHRSPVNSPHKGQWRGALMFSLICVGLNGWINNGDAGDSRRYRAHYDVTVMGCGFDIRYILICVLCSTSFNSWLQQEQFQVLAYGSWPWWMVDEIPPSISAWGVRFGYQTIFDMERTCVKIKQDMKLTRDYV